jgi:predicted nucleic acid-binding protein
MIVLDASIGIAALSADHAHQARERPLSNATSG